MVLSKRDKEIAQLKKDVENAKGASEGEVLKMRDYVRNMELEMKYKKENAESFFERLKESTYNILKL